MPKLLHTCFAKHILGFIFNICMTYVHIFMKYIYAILCIPSCKAMCKCKLGCYTFIFTNYHKLQ